MKGFSVNYEKFLSTISHELYYSTAQYVSKPVSFVYEVCMKKMLAVYKKLVLIPPKFTAIMNLSK